MPPKISVSTFNTDLPFPASPQSCSRIIYDVLVKSLRNIDVLIGSRRLIF